MSITYAQINKTIFKTPIHLENLFRYPVDHLRHHRHQLRAAQ
jgi:hypothetical protein